MLPPKISTEQAQRVLDALKAREAYAESRGIVSGTQASDLAPEVLAQVRQLQEEWGDLAQESGLDRRVSTDTAYALATWTLRQPEPRA